MFVVVIGCEFMLGIQRKMSTGSFTREVLARELSGTLRWSEGLFYLSIFLSLFFVLFRFILFIFLLAKMKIATKTKGSRGI